LILIARSPHESKATEKKTKQKKPPKFFGKKKRKSLTMKSAFGMRAFWLSCWKSHEEPEAPAIKEYYP